LSIKAKQNNLNKVSTNTRANENKKNYYLYVFQLCLIKPSNIITHQDYGKYN